jgi:hypothetical protein
MISPKIINATYNITIANNSFNMYSSNLAYQIDYYSYTAYINTSIVNGLLNITLYVDPIYLLSFSFDYLIYSSQSVNISISNNITQAYAYVEYIPQSINNVYAVLAFLYLAYGNYTYLINTLNSDLGYITNTIFLNQSMNIEIANPFYPTLNIILVNTNISLPNGTMSIYYYDDKPIYPYIHYPYWYSFNSSINITIPANIMIYLNLSTFTLNNITYYPFLYNINPIIVINETGNFIYSNNYSGNLTLSFITYTNLTIYIEYIIPYFISLNFINVKDVYVNYSVYNGNIYNNQSILVNSNFISLPFPQLIYYRIYFSPLNQNYTLIPQFVSGYLTSNISYNIIGILNPSVNTTSINNTLPSPYQFNWSIPNLIIFGYTSDYIFSIAFVSILIGIAVYTGYKLRSDLIPLLILAIGLFLLYIVNLLPLWISILTIAGIFIFYYFFKRGE